MIKNRINALLSRFGYRITQCQPREMSARDHLDDFIARTTFSGKILDIGTPHPSAKPSTTTFDQQGNPDIKGDVHKLSTYVNGTQYDTICAFEVLEHVQYPQKAVDEMYAVLKRGGVLYLATPFIYQIHGEEYGDYWRFTRQGLRHLCAKFSHVEILSNGLELRPNHYITIATK